MALLAAFALYPLQGVDTQCAGTAESLRQANVFSDLLVFAYASLHDWPRFLSAIKERDSGSPQIGDSTRAWSHCYRN